jgi:hypothetical protein
MAIDRGKLFAIDVNDNFRGWDDDMVVGSVHLVETLEFFHTLQRNDWAGVWQLDQFPSARTRPTPPGPASRSCRPCGGHCRPWLFPGHGRPAGHPGGARDRSCAHPRLLGFGWKGLRTAGPLVPVEEYARFCRYLVARYGAQPAVWLAGADGSGREPQVEAGGREIQQWDCYQQPTGIHYRPHSDAGAHQGAPWLDFQWCQTGHAGEHVPERVTLLRSRTPVKAVATGEPTYENTTYAGNAAGWWQGHEAWSNLCAGAMGVVYGAGSLWQWVHRPDEPGHPTYFLAPNCGWREALDFEGSRYVGLVGRILDGLPTTDMSPDWEAVISPRGLSVPGRLHIVYAENGRGFPLVNPGVLPRRYTVVDLRSGAVIAEGMHHGTTGTGRQVLGPFGDCPYAVIFTDEGGITG